MNLRLTTHDLGVHPKELDSGDFFEVIASPTPGYVGALGYIINDTAIYFGHYSFPVETANPDVRVRKLEYGETLVIGH